MIRALCALSLLLTPALVSAQAPAPTKRIRIGTWNIENLGSRKQPRTDADFAAIAKLIKAKQIDVLAFQEVNGKRPLRRLCKHLGSEYSFVIGNSGRFGRKQIGVGFLWNTKRVTLVQAQELRHLPRRDETGLYVFHRKPVSAVFRAKHGGLDFRAVVVHLKAGRLNVHQRSWRDTAKRQAEAKLLGEWLKALLARKGEDQDLLVLGDYNLDPTYPAHKTFSKYLSFLKLKKHHQSIIYFDEQIDHMATSKGLVEEVIKGSYRLHAEQFNKDRKAWHARYSDHIPLTVDLDASRDRDPKATFSPVKPEQKLKTHTTVKASQPKPKKAKPVKPGKREYF